MIQTHKHSQYRVRQLEAIRRLEAVSSDPLSDPVSTIVPMRDEYISDARLCLTVVCFVPECLSSSILNMVRQLSELDSRHYFYPHASMHFTLQNIRIINDPPNFRAPDLLRAAKTLEESLKTASAHKATLKGILELPTSVGVCVYFDDALADTIFGLRESFAEIGLRDDKSYIDDDVVFGNVTFCRYTASPNDSFKQHITELKDVDFGEMIVDHAALITTNAVCHPDRTSIIARVELKRSL